MKILFDRQNHQPLVPSHEHGNMTGEQEFRMKNVETGGGEKNHEEESDNVSNPNLRPLFEQLPNPRPLTRISSKHKSNASSFYTVTSSTWTFIFWNFILPSIVSNSYRRDTST